MNLAPYRKAITALVAPLIGLAIIVLKDRVGLDLSAAESQLVDLVVILLTAVVGGGATYAIPNAPPDLKK